MREPLNPTEIKDLITQATYEMRDNVARLIFINSYDGVIDLRCCFNIRDLLWGLLLAEPWIDEGL